jgi:hypothetical protein
VPQGGAVVSFLEKRGRSDPVSHDCSVVVALAFQADLEPRGPTIPAGGFRAPDSASQPLVGDTDCGPPASRLISGVVRRGWVCRGQ